MRSIRLRRVPRGALLGLLLAAGVLTVGAAPIAANFGFPGRWYENARGDVVILWSAPAAQNVIFELVGANSLGQCLTTSSSGRMVTTDKTPPRYVFVGFGSVLVQGQDAITTCGVNGTVTAVKAGAQGRTSLFSKEGDCPSHETGCAPAPVTLKCLKGPADILTPEPGLVDSGAFFYLVNTCSSAPFPRKAPHDWKIDYTNGGSTIPAFLEVEAPHLLRLKAPKVGGGKARLTAASRSARACPPRCSIFGFKFRLGGRKAKAKRPLQVRAPAAKPKPNPAPPPPSPSAQKCSPQYGIPQVSPKGVSFRAGDIVHFLLYCGQPPGTGYTGVVAPKRITFYDAYGFGNLTWDITTGVFVNRTRFPNPYSISCPPPACWRVISDTDLEVRLPVTLTGPATWVAVVTRPDGKQFPVGPFVIK